MRKINVVLLCVVGLFVGVSFVSGHSGGLDSNGGHYNRKTGEYHYHRRTADTQPERQSEPINRSEPAPDPRPINTQPGPLVDPAPAAQLADIPHEKTTDELVRDHDHRLAELENTIDALRIEIATLKLQLHRP